MFTLGATSTYQDAASKLVSESSNLKDFGYWGGVPILDGWAMTVTMNPDSDLLGVSNFEIIAGDMEDRYPEDVSVERYQHWVTGWADALLVKMFDESGKATKAGRAIVTWLRKLQATEAVDAEDVSEREYEATLAYIGDKARVQEDDAEEIFNWLVAHEPREIKSIDIRGAQPSVESLQRAASALDIYTSMGDDDDEDEDDFDEDDEE